MALYRPYCSTHHQSRLPLHTQMSSARHASRGLPYTLGQHYRKVTASLLCRTRAVYKIRFQKKKVDLLPRVPSVPSACWRWQPPYTWIWMMCKLGETPSTPSSDWSGVLFLAQALEALKVCTGASCAPGPYYSQV